MQIYTSGTFILHPHIFRYIRSMGRYVRRLGSDPNLTYPSETPRPIRDCLLVPFTHLTVKRERTFELYSSFLLCLELLGCCIQALYTNFFASRQRRLLVFQRIASSTTCIQPNFDSALGISHRLYSSPDSHATFTCDMQCAAP